MPGTTVSLAMLGFIGALKTFDIPYLVTDGGPHRTTTEFLGTYIYRVGIRQAHIGYAAALSMVLLVLAIAGAVTIGRMSRTSAGSVGVRSPTPQLADHPSARPRAADDPVPAAPCRDGPRPFAGLGFHNFVVVWQTGVIPTFFKNSILVSLGVIALVYAGSMTAGVRIRQLRVPGKSCSSG